jgi:nitroreductase
MLSFSSPSGELGQARTSENLLRVALSYAVLAPSSHNSQPWLFKVTCGGVDLLADRSRRLPVVDPNDRELLISCGAALHHLETALGALGESFRVDLLPDETDPDLLASLSLLGRSEPDPRAGELLEAMAERRTTRLAFRRRAPQPYAVASIARACRAAGVDVDILTNESRLELGSLIAEADRAQLARAEFRKELAAWVRSNQARSGDGIPGFTQGVGDLASYLGPLVVRTFDRGDGQAARDQELALHSPTLVVLSTKTDDSVARIEAGRALSALLIEATRLGLAASFLNQPLEIPDLRLRVGKLLPTATNFPQLVLRLGYYRGEPLRATPRRELKEVLV